MLSSLKLLQKERMMWQVLSQEAKLRCDDAQSLVQTQVDKAIRKERELKSYISDSQEIHAVQLLKEQKEKCLQQHWRLP